MSHRQPVAPLSDTRLIVPLPSAGLVPRPRVARLLDHAARHPITLVSAGPGTGKTLAVATWAREVAERCAVAWVSVDSLLSTPDRFWVAVTTALTAVLEPAEDRLPRDQPDVGDGDVVAALAGLVNRREVVLVLDDVHELDDEVLTDLDQVLRMLPTGLSLILVARHDPPLSLNRHRVAGRLAEVRVADLAFTTEEVGSLLTESGLCVPDDVVATLVETSDGWAALVRLAVITMQAADDPVAAGRNFNGGQPMVAGYLGEEVLANLPPEHQEFLVRTGVAARICAPLATALTDKSTAPELLAELFGGDLPMVKLEDSGWYRYHPLLRQTLQARLRQGHPDLEPELHRRAAHWLEAHGEWLPALEHAIESGDHELAVQVVLRSAAVVLFTAEWTSLPALIERIPPDSAPHDPELQTVLAVQALLRGQTEIARDLGARAVDGLATLPEARRAVALLTLRVLEAVAAVSAAEPEATLRAAGQAEELANAVTVEQAPGWARLRDLPVALRGVAQIWSGRPQTAVATLLRVRADAPDPMAPSTPGVHLSGFIAFALALSGEIEPARERAVATLRGGEGAGRPRSHDAAVTWCALAMARVHQGDAEAALTALVAGERVTSQTWPDPCVAAAFHLGRAEHALLTGDLRGLRRWLAEVDRDLRRHPRMTYAVRPRLILGVEAALLAGAPGVAQKLLKDYDAQMTAATAAITDERDLTVPVRARVLLATGRAQEVPDTVADELDAPGWVGAAAWLAVALAHHKLRQDALATDALAQALDAAVPHQAVLVFQQAGPALEAMLQRHQQVVGSHSSFVRVLLERMHADGNADLTPLPARFEPLTERELAVLAYLPTMSSNVEIAAQLRISVNTVKRHLKSVHRKLGVGTRRDAVRVARRLDLLPR